MQDHTFRLMIPSGKSLNLTNTVHLLGDVVVPLQRFLNDHNQTDLVTYVGMTLYFSSVYGLFSNDYCYVLPRNVVAVCPAVRALVSGRFGGG